MSNRDDVRDFLTSRRAQVTPQDAGIPDSGNRRVPGLRRGEVAMLAGVSIEYYSRVERGALAGVSESVLDAIARALMLDDAERSHLFDLARAANSSPLQPARRSPRTKQVRTSLQLALQAITAGPAFVRNGRMDVVAGNRLWYALYNEMYELQGPQANLARYQFLNRESAERFYPNWDLAADTSVAILRTEAGRAPYDKDLQDLIGELSTRSDEFRIKWGAHNVRLHTTGDKHFHHPVVGDVHMLFEAMDLTAEPGLNFLIYTAEPGSPTEDALKLLASWAATQDLDALSLERADQHAPPRSATEA